MNSWITTGGIVYDVYTIQEAPYAERKSAANCENPELSAPPEGYIHGHAFSMRFVDAHPVGKVRHGPKQAAYHNYLLGRDSTRWARMAGLYREIVLEEVYAGIDIRFYFEDEYLRYDLLLAPHADARQLVLAFEGIERTTIDSAGNLHLHTALGAVEQRGLQAFQIVNGRQQHIPCTFALRQDGNVGFRCGPYNTSMALTIDPVIYSTLLGGRYQDIVHGVRAGKNGTAFVYASSVSANYPTTPGAYSRVYSSNIDMVISKLNGSGNALIFSTFLGGSDCEYLGMRLSTSNKLTCHFSRWYDNGMVIDQQENVFVCGVTTSDDFPTTSGAFQRYLIGGMGHYDSFVAKLSRNGDRLLYATLIGGADAERSFDLKIDAEGHAYLYGLTWSTDYTRGTRNFPTTRHALFESSQRNTTFFLSKFNPQGSALVFSTLLEHYYLEGNSGGKIALDSAANIYVANVVKADTNGFRATPGALDDTVEDFDIGIRKINRSGTDLLYATLLGKKGSEFPVGIEINSRGEAVIVAISYSLQSGSGRPDFPLTEYAEVRDRHASDDAGTLSIISADGRELIYSSFVSHIRRCLPSSMALDRHDNIYVYGSTTFDFPILDTLFKPTIDKHRNFLYRFRGQDYRPDYWTCFGTSNWSIPVSIHTDAVGHIYLTGVAEPTAFPTTPNVISDELVTDGCDIFVIKLFPLGCEMKATIEGRRELCIGERTELQTRVREGYGGYSYKWRPDRRISSVSSPNPTVYPDSTTTYYLEVRDLAGCSAVDSIRITVWPKPAPEVLVGGPPIFCEGDSITLSTGSYASYLWSTYDSTQSIRVGKGGDYWVTVFNEHGCKGQSSIQHVEVLAQPDVTISGEAAHCIGEVAEYSAHVDSAYTIRWNITAGGTIIGPADSANLRVHWHSSGTWPVIAEVRHRQLSCSSYDTLDTQIAPAPLAQITPSVVEVCPGDSIHLKAGGGIRYEWSPAVEISATDIADPTVFPTANRTYTLIVSNAAGCRDTQTVDIVMNTDLNVDAGQDRAICAGQGVYLQAAGADSYSWEPHTNISGADSPNPYVWPEVTTTYYVHGSKRDCSGRDSVRIVVRPLPQLRVRGDTALCAGDSVQLLADGALRYLWEPADGLSDPFVPNPLAAPQRTTVYTVHGHDEHNCYDSAQITVLVHNYRRSMLQLVVPDVEALPGDVVPLYIQFSDIADFAPLEYFSFELMYAPEAMKAQPLQLIPSGEFSDWVFSLRDDPLNRRLLIAGQGKPLSDSADLRIDFAVMLSNRQELFVPLSPANLQTNIRPNCAGIHTMGDTLQLSPLCLRGHRAVSIDGAGFALAEANPQPADTETAIRFSVGFACFSRLAVYNTLGREVAVLVDGYTETGSHSITLDCTALASGMYFYRLDAGPFSAVRRLLVP